VDHSASHPWVMFSTHGHFSSRFMGVVIGGVPSVAFPIPYYWTF